MANGPENDPDGKNRDPSTSAPTKLDLNSNTPAPEPYVDEIGLSFIAQTQGINQSQFEIQVAALKGDATLELPTLGDELSSGWQISFDSDEGMYQLHKQGDIQIPIELEQAFDTRTEIEDGALIPENSRIWLQSNPFLTLLSVPVNNQTLIADPFLALSAPVVNLNNTESSLHAGEEMPWNTRYSAGATFGRTLFGHWAATTDNGGKHSHNEDAFIKIDASAIGLPDGSREAGTILVGLDGLGGAEGSLYLVDNAEKVIGHEAPRGRSVNQMVNTLLKSTQNEIQDGLTSVIAQKLPLDMATCIVGVTILRDRVRIEKHGDARTIIMRDGTALDPTPTIDDNIPGHWLRQGIIDEKQAFQHDQRSVVVEARGIKGGEIAYADSLEDRLERMQRVLDLDLDDEHDYIVDELRTFCRWMGDEEYFGQLLLHRTPELEAQWQKLSTQIEDLVKERKELVDVASDLNQFFSQTQSAIQAGAELHSKLETHEWIPLRKDDIILIVSDGVTDLLFNSEILHEIKDMSDPQEIAAHLRQVVDEIVKTGKYDSHDPNLAKIPRSKRDHVLIIAYRHDIDPDDTDTQASNV